MTKSDKGRTKNWKTEKTSRGEKEKFKEIETYKNEDVHKSLKLLENFQGFLEEKVWEV